MDESIRRYLGWIVAVLMIVTAAGSFLFRYAGFDRFLDSAESVALSDSLVKAGDGLPPSGNSLSPTGGLDSRMPLRATREGLVRECGGGDLLGVLMLADTAGVRDNKPVSGGLPAEPSISDGAPAEPSALDDVPAVSIFVDGIPGCKVDLGGIRMDARFRVVYSIDESGAVTSASYEGIR